MVLCKDYNLLFLHIPKTAGTSIKTILINDLGGINYRTHVAAKFIDEHIKDYSYLFKFAVVRNPYSRAVSWYNHLIRESEFGKKKEEIVKPLSFEYFVKEQKAIYNNRIKLKNFGLWSTQKEYISKDGRVIIDYVCRYENLQNDMDLLFKKIVGKTFQLPHKKNWGVQDDWEKYYTDELKDIVHDRMKEDFEYFGYRR